MQKARGRTLPGRLIDRAIVLPRLVDIRFQSLFTPLAGVLFTFPSRYWFTIGDFGVFSLTGWCRLIPTRRLRPRGTQDTAIIGLFIFTGLSPPMVLLSKSFNLAY